MSWASSTQEENKAPAKTLIDQSRPSARIMDHSLGLPQRCRPRQYARKVKEVRRRIIMAKTKKASLEGMYILSATLSDEPGKKRSRRSLAGSQAALEKCTKYSIKDEKNWPMKSMAAEKGTTYLLYFSAPTTNHQRHVERIPSQRGSHSLFNSAHAKAVPEKIEFKQLAARIGD